MLNKRAEKGKNDNSMNKQLMSLIALLMGIFSLVIAAMIEILIFSIYNDGNLKGIFSFSNVTSYFFAIGLFYDLTLIAFLAVIIVRRIKIFRECLTLLGAKEKENVRTANEYLRF